MFRIGQYIRHHYFPWKNFSPPCPYIFPTHTHKHTHTHTHTHTHHSLTLFPQRGSGEVLLGSIPRKNNTIETFDKIETFNQDYRNKNISVQILKF